MTALWTLNIVVVIVEEQNTTSTTVTTMGSMTGFVSAELEKALLGQALTRVLFLATRDYSPPPDRNEAIKVFFSENRFSLSGQCFDIEKDLEIDGYEHLLRMKHLTIKFEVERLGDLDDSELSTELNVILGQVSSKCKAGINVNFCIPLYLLGTRNWKQDHLQGLKVFSRAMLEYGLTNCSILVDNIFDIKCPDLKRWYDGKVHWARLFGPGIMQSIDLFFAHVDETYGT